MKRYKVVKDVVLGYSIKPRDGSWNIQCFIPAGREICLEEVKEEECRWCYGGHSSDDCDVIKRREDQPLTPKDVGMRKGRAMADFISWLWDEGKKIIDYMPDEEFDRLFQQFLSKYKK